MNQTSQEPAGQADDNVVPAAKPSATTRRPRRMARESGNADARDSTAEGDAPAKPDKAAPPAAKPAAKPRGDSKIASVIALLKRGEGATLAELVEATSWLPHTTRAALTGLRKKGHAIAKSSRDGATCYRIGEAT